MSSFLIYIYTIVHLIYFFLYGFKYSDIFCCSWYFYPVLVDSFFHTVFSGLNYRLDLTKKLMSKTEIFCHC